MEVTESLNSTAEEKILIQISRFYIESNIYFGSIYSAVIVLIKRLKTQANVQHFPGLCVHSSLTKLFQACVAALVTCGGRVTAAPSLDTEPRTEKSELSISAATPALYMCWWLW